MSYSIMRQTVIESKTTKYIHIMKRFYKVLMALIVAALSCQNLYAYDFVVNNIYYNKTSGNAVEVTHNGTNYPYSGNVKIPSGVTYGAVQYIVTGIGSGAFSYNGGNLLSITIPNTIKYIDVGAFYGCKKLKSVYVSDISWIYNCTFSGESSIPTCNGADLYINGVLLESLTLPSTKITDYAFCGCNSLKSVPIPSGGTIIGKDAFKGCSNLKSVYVSSLSNLDNCSFANENSHPSCNGADLYINGKKLQTLTLEGSIFTNSKFFYGCTSLISLTIPSTMLELGANTFVGCSNLRKIICLPNTVPEGFGDAFSAVGDRMTYVGNHNSDDSASKLGGTLNIYTNLSSMF